MSEIFNSEEIRSFEKEQFLKKNSYSFMQKAGKRVSEFIINKSPRLVMIQPKS